jgi:predicted transcriptional regulator
MLDQVYGAIADPTRRAILNVLAEGETNVGSLAERFPISLNGVSKHVKVLERAWLEHYRKFWNTRLDALEGYLMGKAGTSPRRG